MSPAPGQSRTGNRIEIPREEAKLAAYGIPSQFVAELAMIRIVMKYRTWYMIRHAIQQT
jgi:hypothetical protein